MEHFRSLRVKPGARVDLTRIDPADTLGETKARAERQTVQLADRLRDLQYAMYAENRRSLLVVLQGMDGAGKDGTIRHVFGAMNPQGVHTRSFKVPSAEEAAHDFLWRAHRHTPGRGEVTLFNRSHYEDVLVVRVHGLVAPDVWKKRYELIGDFERNLAESGTVVLKFFLHISAREQLLRFRKRLEDPAHQWKISPSDYVERERWADYQEAYEDVLRRTSTAWAPWFVIPADHKWLRNLAVARIVVDALEKLDMRFPEPAADLDEIRRLYHRASRR